MQQDYNCQRRNGANSVRAKPQNLRNGQLRNFWLYLFGDKIDLLTPDRKQGHASDSFPSQSNTLQPLLQSPVLVPLLYSLQPNGLASKREATNPSTTRSCELAGSLRPCLTALLSYRRHPIPSSQRGSQLPRRHIAECAWLMLEMEQRKNSKYQKMSSQHDVCFGVVCSSGAQMRKQPSSERV